MFGNMLSMEDAATAEIALLVADLFEVAGRLRRAGDGAARAVGQSQARWQVLSVISEGTWTVPRIAERLGVTRQNVQRIADELVDGRLAEWAANERHARSPLLVLAPSGERALREIRRSASDLDASLAGALGPRDLAAVRGGIRKLLAFLRAD